MTDSRKQTSHPSSRRTFQDDLLQDLRQTAPMSESPTSGAPSRATERPAADGRDKTPTVELRVTPTRWLAPSLRPEAGGRGMVFSAGPLSVSVDLFRR